jgi:hypothetical protein
VEEKVSDFADSEPRLSKPEFLVNSNVTGTLRVHVHEDTILNSKYLVKGLHALPVGDPMILPSTRADALDLSRFLAGVAAFSLDFGRSNRR